jgi:hypothetical protein
MAFVILINLLGDVLGDRWRVDQVFSSVRNKRNP